MSGIAGSVRLDGNPLAVAEAATMATSMAHRGPDGIGQWTDGIAALGLCLLRIQKHAPHRATPRLSPDGRYAIVFDGRIDNRAELASRLHVDKIELEDDALLLEGFRRWRHELPEQLLGEFAFAIWDTEEHALFCARDPVGARPFYFRHEHGRFVFASEEMAVAAGLGVSPEADPHYLASLLIRGYYRFDTSQSPIAGIGKLPPGHWLRLDAGGRFEQRAYWDWRERSEPPLDSDGDYEERLRHLMREAMQCRIPDTAPATLLLSGGIDSLALHGTARTLEREGFSTHLHVHALVRDDPGCLESANIGAALADDESRATLIDANRPWDSEHDQEARDELLRRPRPTDLSLVYAHWLARDASRRGFRGVFTGVSGDMALLTPSDPLARTMRSGDLLGAWRESKALALHHSLLRDRGRTRLVARAIWHAGAPQRLQEALARVRAQRTRHRALAMAGIRVDGFPWRDLDDRLNREVGDWMGACAEPPDAEHRFVLRAGAIQLGLEGYGHAMALHGMEHLDPWSDVRLLLFCLSLPLRQRTRDGWYKYLARSAFSPWLPVLVWHGEKQHLGNLVSRRVRRWQQAEALAGREPPDALIRLIGPSALQLIADAASPSPPPNLAHTALDAITWLRWMARPS